MSGLGDVIETALRAAGITSERVERWLGRPCGCEERKRRLNSLGFWARKTLRGSIASAREYLTAVMGDGDHAKDD